MSYLKLAIYSKNVIDEKIFISISPRSQYLFVENVATTLEQSKNNAKTIEASLVSLCTCRGLLSVTPKHTSAMPMPISILI